jgi:hypothetical protein
MRKEQKIPFHEIGAQVKKGELHLVRKDGNHQVVFVTNVSYENEKRLGIIDNMMFSVSYLNLDIHDGEYIPVETRFLIENFKGYKNISDLEITPFDLDNETDKNVQLMKKRADTFHSIFPEKKFLVFGVRLITNVLLIRVLHKNSKRI